jgi:hypothetical protein
MGYTGGHLDWPFVPSQLTSIPLGFFTARPPPKPNGTCFFGLYFEPPQMGLLAFLVFDALVASVWYYLFKYHVPPPQVRRCRLFST